MTSRRVAALVASALVTVAVFAGGLGRHGSRGAMQWTPDTGSGSMGDPRAAIFVERGCPECHAIAALGIKAATDVGPDLTFAYADVLNRYGVSLRSFFDNTPGLMGWVLASHVHLTQADRDSITRILHEVYQKNLAAMDREMPSFPPGRSRPPSRPDSVRTTRE
ncbi:MAG TPA: hypothetical protein VEU73_10805 [Gemmatimonadales bacterium]|nr:hypothetical protein [Gemmatimonadales bacterium]